MKLSDKALKDLSVILSKETGGLIPDFSEEELNEIGELFLTIAAENLKMKVTKPELFIPMCK